MRTLPVALVVGACALGNAVLAQDTPAPKPTYTSEAMLRRISSRAGAAACRLPDRTTRAVNATVTLEGRTYRCVEVLDENLQPRGVAWTPVAPALK